MSIPLLSWQQSNGLDIHVWHVFFDMAFGLSLNRAEELIDQRLVEPTIQTYQAPNGTTTKKTIYKFFYYLAYPLGESTNEPTLDAKYIIDKNGHILPYVNFVGGNLVIDRHALEVLNDLAQTRRIKKDEF